MLSVTRCCELVSASVPSFQRSKFVVAGFARNSAVPNLAGLLNSCEFSYYGIGV